MNTASFPRSENLGTFFFKFSIGKSFKLNPVSLRYFLIIYIMDLLFEFYHLNAILYLFYPVLEQFL